MAPGRLDGSHNPPRVDFEFALGKPGSDVLIGETDGRIVASVMVGHDGHRGWVYYVAVDPDCQKLGYGAEMMRAAEMWLKTRGVRKIQLLVRDSNAVAQGFYKAIGYEVNPVAVLSKWLTEPFAGQATSESDSGIARILSTRRPSMSITSKIQPPQAVRSPEAGRLPNCAITKPASVSYVPSCSSGKFRNRAVRATSSIGKRPSKQP